mgnify:CR=1 FL=1
MNEEHQRALALAVVSAASAARVNPIGFTIAVAYRIRANCEMLRTQPVTYCGLRTSSTLTCFHSDVSSAASPVTASFDPPPDRYVKRRNLFSARSIFGW